MKKIAIALCGAAALLLAGCASTAKAAKTDTAAAKTTEAAADTVPADVISGAAGVDADENGAYATFADAEFKQWNLDNAKFYLLSNGLYSKVQSEGADWARDITKKMLAIVPAGDDNIIKMDLNLPSKKLNTYAYLFNISNQATAKKNISGCVMKCKFYIPAEYCKDGAAAYPILRLVVRDGNWNQSFASGDIDNMTTKDIGAGWHVFTFDFTNGTFECGNKKGTFKVAQTAVVNSVDFNFYADGIPATMKTPFYMDYVRFDGIK